MNITDLLKDPNKAKEVLREAIYDENKELIEILIPIVRDPYLTYEYAYLIVKGKVKDEWEDIIARDAEASYSYAARVLKGRFERGEDAISKNAFYSFHYADKIIKGRWEKGEDAIASDSWSATNYARDVLRDRFKKGEEVIIKDRHYLNEYIKFLKQIGKLDEFLKDHPEVKVHENF
jgi:uncharacterized membrane protein